MHSVCMHQVVKFIRSNKYSEFRRSISSAHANRLVIDINLQVPINFDLALEFRQQRQFHRVAINDSREAAEKEGSFRGNSNSRACILRISWPRAN